MRPESKILRPVKDGDALTIERWNDVIDAVNRSRLLPSQGSNVDLITTPVGTAIRIRSGYAGYVGYSVTAISARSGTTAGSGSVNPVSLDASTSQLSSDSTSVLVWNVASASIAANKYCWVEPGADGNLYVGPLDC
jgi:hypothetical protein